MRRSTDEELSDAENCMETARFEVVPCGLEATVSYGTARPKDLPQSLPPAISGAADRWQVPCADGIFTRTVDCRENIEQVMGDLRALTAAIVGRGHIVVTLGGEHSVSYGAVMVVDALDAPLGLVHIDAHADFRAAIRGINIPMPVSCICWRRKVCQWPLSGYGRWQRKKNTRAALKRDYHDAGDLVRGNIAACRCRLIFLRIYTSL